MTDAKIHKGPDRATATRTLKVAIFRDGKLDHYEHVPDPRQAFIDTYNELSRGSPHRADFPRVD